MKDRAYDDILVRIMSIPFILDHIDSSFYTLIQKCNKKVNFLIISF